MIRVAAFIFWLLNLAATTITLFIVLSVGAMIGAALAVQWFIFGTGDVDDEIIEGQSAWQKRNLREIAR